MDAIADKAHAVADKAKAEANAVAGAPMAAVGALTKTTDHPPGEWQTGLCGCLEDCGACVDSVVCSCCQIGRQKSSLDGTESNMSCCDCILAFPCYCCCISRIRCLTAEKFHVDEGCCCSTCKGFLCMCLSLAQTHRHLTRYGVKVGTCCGGAVNEAASKAVANAPMS